MKSVRAGARTVRIRQFLLRGGVGQERSSNATVTSVVWRRALCAQLVGRTLGRDADGARGRSATAQQVGLMNDRV